MMDVAPKRCAWRRMARSSWLASVLITLGIAGCEPLQTGRPSQAEAPIQPQSRPTLGITFEVDHFRTTWDYTRVVVDRSGLGHVIVAIKDSREVHHVLVGPDGVLGREIVATDIKPGNLDAAFDGLGGLHILVDGEHYAKVDGAWRGGVRTPWREAGLEPRGRGFVPGGKGLLWQFLVAGEDIGAPGRWDIVGDPLIIFPWRSHGWKLMFVPDATPAYTSWTVLDPQDNSVVDGYWTASDDDGVVTLLYRVRELSPLRYARFDTTVEPAAATAVARMKGGRILRSITGTPSTLAGPLEWLASDVAAAPDGATRLFVRPDGASRLVHGDTWGVPVALPIASFHKVQLASAGGEAFHALVIGLPRHFWSGSDVPLYYLLFSDGRWSEPAELGIAPSLGFPVPAINLGSAAGGRALAVWPTASGILGRWIMLESR